MIQANELRIGNWAYDSSKNINYRVTGRDIYEIELEQKGKFFARVAKPILLTPEILEKAGFVNAYSSFHDGRFIYNLKTFPTLHFQFDSDYDAIIVSNAEREDGMMFGCKHIHQLQNLYFALTGKELEINL